MNTRSSSTERLYKYLKAGRMEYVRVRGRMKHFQTGLRATITAAAVALARTGVLLLSGPF